MVSKKTDIKKPSKTSSLRAPKKKAAQSKTKCSHHHAPKDKTIDIVNELKTKIAELERFASFPRLNPNPVLEVDSSGEILFINNAAKDILRKLNLGEEGDVFLPKDINTILRGLNHKKEKEFYREVMIQDRVFGETLNLAPEFHAVRIYAHDITERKRMETGIRRAEISLSKERDFTSAVLSTTGAHGYVSKVNLSNELITALHQILQGKKYSSSSATGNSGKNSEFPAWETE
jgi:PAS domain-containing protein